MCEFSGKSWQTSAEDASQPTSPRTNFFFINRCLNLSPILLTAMVLFGCSKDENIRNQPFLNLTEKGAKISVDSSTGRFQLVSNPMLVIDTVTGAVWRAGGPAGGPYHLTRICYKSDTTMRLMPTPYDEELLPDDPQLKSEVLSRHKEACR